jgi:ribosomal protein S18 acetylase RimI-like enzyme
VLTIRPTKTEDLDRVVAIEAAADTKQWLGNTGRSWHERALADPDQEHLLAVYDGAVIGFGVLAGAGTGDGTIELRRMVVHPASRGGGHGRALLEAVSRRAQDRHGARQVWPDVKTHNQRARGLYEA